MMYPELDHSVTTTARPEPPPYKASPVNGILAVSSMEDDPEPEGPPPAYPVSSPRESNVPATIFTTTYPRSVGNRMVRTVNPNSQIPATYPGFAFCKFTPGRIETVIRFTVVVMLLVLISLTAVTIHEEGQVITDSLLTVDATGWRGVAGWIICAASLAIIIEGLVLTLRFLNPSCMNNNYSICGGLDISKCVLVAIGLFIGCIITGAEATLAAEDFDDHCNNNPYNTDNNEACRHLKKIHGLLIAVTVVNVVCIVLLGVLATWDIAFIYNGLYYKIPVLRGRDQANQQR